MIKHSDDEPLLNASIRLDNLPVGGRNIKVSTNETQRAAISQLLKIDALDSLTAELSATPMKGGIQVVGKLHALVTQPCVATFVPVTQDVEEEFRRIFLSGEDETNSNAAGSEVFIDLEGDDLPDYFAGPNVDFSELLLEVLSLAIDPFPRAPGAEAASTGDVVEEISPFAALKALKSTGD